MGITMFVIWVVWSSFQPEPLAGVDNQLLANNVVAAYAAAESLVVRVVVSEQSEQLPPESSPHLVASIMVEYDRDHRVKMSIAWGDNPLEAYDFISEPGTDQNKDQIKIFERDRLAAVTEEYVISRQEFDDPESLWDPHLNDLSESGRGCYTGSYFRTWVDDRADIPAFWAELVCEAQEIQRIGTKPIAYRVLVDRENPNGIKTGASDELMLFDSGHGFGLMVSDWNTIDTAGVTRFRHFDYLGKDKDNESMCNVVVGSNNDGGRGEGRQPAN